MGEYLEQKIVTPGHTNIHLIAPLITPGRPGLLHVYPYLASDPPVGRLCFVVFQLFTLQGSLEVTS